MRRPAGSPDAWGRLPPNDGDIGALEPTLSHQCILASLAELVVGTATGSVMRAIVSQADGSLDGAQFPLAPNTPVSENGA